MESKTYKKVLIIPYFGTAPDYFNLWLKSAEKNPSYTFYIYSDLDLKVNTDSNVKVKYITFNDLRKIFYKKLGKKIVLNNPYKLCDYKPVYGYIFEDDIKEFDFWGFCDIDLIFGNLQHFIPEQIFSEYDKLFFNGHFCLMRNNEKMNKLFLQKIPNVCDYRYAFSTNYSCHFDENGTIAYASETDKSIRTFKEWSFYDIPFSSYQFTSMRSKSERILCWDNGILNVYCSDYNCREVMYAHLQKRKMTGWNSLENENKYVIMRNYFVSKDNDIEFYLNQDIDSNEQQLFDKRIRTFARKQALNNLCKGALKYKLKNFKSK